MPRTERKYKRILTSVDNQAKLRSRGYTPVFSSNVSAIQRDGEDLYIRFHNGTVYVYPNQGNRFNDLLLSPSKGEWVWNELRRKNVSYSRVSNFPLEGDLDLTNEQMEEQLREQGLLQVAISMVANAQPILSTIPILGDNGVIPLVTTIVNTIPTQ